MSAAISGMKTQMQALNVVGNNIANVNTNGYKVTLLGEPAVKVLDGVTLPEVFGSFEACGVTDDGYTSYFNTLYDAIEHCDRVTLLEDANVSPLNIVKDYTLDMNGHSITANDNAINIITPVTGTPESANIVITNSAAAESVIYGGIEISNKTKSNDAVYYTFTLGKNVKVSADVAMHVLGNGAERSVTVNINGTVESTGDDAAIQGNGLRDGTVININDGAVVDGGNAAGIYHPQNGVLNINGGTVKGYTGIYMRDGELNISGGSIKVVILIILLLSAVCSALIDNIPFAATMVPVVQSIAATQGMDLSVLAWALSLGTDLGGNATPIGASANVVATSVSAKSGHPISWGKYCKYCVPATVLVIAVSLGCLFLRYL